jgi:hypothetical protein
MSQVDASYRRYHAELFPGQEVSCWEKHQNGAGNCPRPRARSATNTRLPADNCYRYRGALLGTRADADGDWD